MENPEDYEQGPGMEAQLDYNDFDQEDPEIQENITELQGSFHDREMGVMDGMQEMADYNIPGNDVEEDTFNLEAPEPAGEVETEGAYTFEDEENTGAVGGGFAA